LAYTKTVWSTGDTITASLANNWETQYDEAKADLDAKMNNTTGHKHSGATDDAPKLPLTSLDTDVATQAELDTHTGNMNNPHSVTAAQAEAAPSSHVGAGGTAHAAATTSVAGFMSAADKSKLNGIETGATADQTANEILNALKTVDSDTSGLNANTLQGKVANDFMESSIIPGEFSVFEDSGIEVIKITSYTKSIGVIVGMSGTYRVKMWVRLNNNSTGTAYARIYVNGVAEGTERSVTALPGASDNTLFTEDIILNAGDEVQVYMKVSGTQTYDRVYLDNFELCVENNLPIFKKVGSVKSSMKNKE